MSDRERSAALAPEILLALAVAVIVVVVGSRLVDFLAWLFAGYS